MKQNVLFRRIRRFGDCARVLRSLPAYLPLLVVLLQVPGLTAFGQSLDNPMNFTVHEITIRGSAERIFDAMTKPNQLVNWWRVEGRFHATAIRSDLRVGGKWTMQLDAHGRQLTVGGEYLSVQRHSLLEFTWIRGGEGEDPTETVVRFDFEERRPGETTVRVTHSGLVTDSLRKRNGGWPMILTLLKDCVENSKPNDG